MPLVLITGVNGFVGSNVALELIRAGYQVRGTLRGGKIDRFKQTIGDKFPALEVVQVDDVATADLSDVLQGVDAVIHVAVPLPFGGPGPKENLNIATEGYVNVLRQAVKAGISKVVITGSWAATVDPTLEQAFKGLVSSEKDWSSAAIEEFLSGEHANNPMWTYLAAKALGERAAWKYASQEPSLDLSIILAPFIFGPYVHGFPVPEQSALGSNQHIYTLLSGAVPPPLPPSICDVRDVAQAHVAALEVPKATIDIEDKRFLVCGGVLIWKDAVEYLHQVHPELSDRIPPLDVAFPSFPGPPTIIDVTRAKEALKMKNYRDWKATLVATVESLLETEKTWMKA